MINSGNEIFTIVIKKWSVQAGVNMNRSEI